MKKKHIMLILPFVLLLVITFIAVSGSEVDYEQKQKELVESVQGYLEDELYIRCIPVYEEACSYDTPQTPELEKKLEEIYMAYGDYDSYTELAAKRIDKQTAEVSEYIYIADSMIGDGDYTEGMDVIRKGMAQFTDNEELQIYYKEHHYQFIFISGKYPEMQAAADGSIPVSDGAKWGYLSSGGRMLTGFDYLNATPFSDGFAVVNIDGTWYCINSSFQKWSVDKAGIKDAKQFSSGYARVEVDDGWVFANSEMQYGSSALDWIGSFSNGLAGFSSDGKYGFFASNLSEQIGAKYDGVALNDFEQAFNSERAFVKSGDNYIMIDKEGNRIGSESFEDAYAFLNGGSLAAVKKNGKWGFVNTSGKVVIDCQFEGAKSFSANGMAAVSSGEKWGYINTEGEVVIDYLFEEVRPFNGICAQVYYQDGWMLIAMLDQVY